MEWFLTQAGLEIIQFALIAAAAVFGLWCWLAVWLAREDNEWRQKFDAAEKDAATEQAAAESFKPQAEDILSVWRWK